MPAVKSRKPAAKSAAGTTPSQPAGIDRSQVLARLLKLHNRLMAPFSTHMEKRYKISLNEFRALMTIGNLGTTASHEIVEKTGVNAMAVSRAVSELKRHGRVSVDIDPQNRRRKSICLTTKGKALYEQMLPQSKKVADFLFAALRPDEIMAFDHFVKTLISQLEATDDKGRSLFLEETRPENS